MSKSAEIRILFSIAVLGISFFGNSQAATINITTSATVYDPVAGAAAGTGALALDTDIVNNDTSITGDSSANADASISNPGTVEFGHIQSGTSNADGSVDIVSGTLRTSVTTTYEGLNGGNGATASAIATLSETFIASGSGTVTAYFSVTGAYNIATEPAIHPPSGTPVSGGTLSFQVDAELGLGGLGAGVVDSIPDPALDCSPLGCTSKSGVISDVLSGSYFVGNGATVTVFARLITQLLHGEGTLDLSHTGLLLLTTTDGLTLIPADLRFLANPAFGTEVPIPAALPLLAAGIGAMGFMGWRKRRKTYTN